MTINSATYLKSLHELLLNTSSLEEIRTLCFSLHVDYESISGAEKQVVIRELLLGLGRNGRLPDLISLAQQQRPLISCPPMPDDFTLPKSLAGDNRDMPVTNYSYYGDVVHGDKVEGIRSPVVK
ncbi:MAG: hypothetical protein IPH82_29200 [Chloroflexi bacterium]|nr:hypothetical protein [Chloroflexota bacterium]